jgi:hypothetical protein
MRKYVLSTRSHNTIRVNGMDQNRRKNYRWEDDEITKKSEMAFNITDAYDFASSSYDEGYGPDAERLSKHARSVILMKNPTYAEKPFFIVTDRLYSVKKNRYESIWHMSADNLATEKLNASSSDVCVLCSGADGMVLEIVTGQTEPEWQGWITKTGLQGDYIPAPTLRYCWEAIDSRAVTVFYPSSLDACPFIGVETSGCTDGSEIKLLLRNGGVIVIDENDYN